MKRNVYSVAQINSYIKKMFSQDFMLRQISIKGEVSNCKYHTSGHIYFTIKDEQAAIKAVMFAGSRAGLNFQMKDGDCVIVSGSVEIYEKTGVYQIYARTIELDGEGDLYQKFEQLKKQLEEMGMFSDEYKQRIPQFAKRVGIVTAPTGAAIMDIKNISSRRNPYVQMILYPALVQGEGAAASIVKGIQTLDAMDMDIIIVGRGGGSIEDLWAFNEEIVARAIFDCRTPIISAVGHETDFTIADFVADLRAPTPSAAAELAVWDYRILIDQLETYRNRMKNLVVTKHRFYAEKLKNFQTRINYLSPQNRLNENRMRHGDIENKIRELMKQKLKDSKHRLALLSSKLDAGAPTKKLSSGYAYVEGKNGSVKSVNDISAGDVLDFYLIDGKATAVVDSVTKQ